MKKINVLIVDDSALMRKLLTEILNDDPYIEVVGTANDPFDAREKIKRLNPDVLTLDVEMPKMDGVTFLSNLMRLRPMPVLMVSTLTEKGADITFQALELGAVDFVTKPKVDQEKQLELYANEIIHKVKVAASAQVNQISKASASKVTQRVGCVARMQLDTTDKIIAIGSSTGGTEALKEVLGSMPSNCPGIVIAQHMPEAFTRPFAERLDRTTGLIAKEAENGDQILPGHVYVAPGGQHLEVKLDGARYRCRLTDAPPVNRFKPSVDVLFDSVAKYAGKNAVGVILTGMGKDGAVGLKGMQEKGALTIAQDEASSIVWGMPGAAVELGAADHVLPLDKIASQIISCVSKIAA